MFANAQPTGQMPLELIDRPRRGIGKAIQQMQNAGWLKDEIPATVIADRIAHANVGLFELWQRGQMSAEELGVQLKLNVLISILGVSGDEKRSAIKASLDQALAALASMNGRGFQ